MSEVTRKALLDARVHLGHVTKRWNPKMAPFLFDKHDGIHIIDLNKTMNCLGSAKSALMNIVASGKKVMFVATKKQAKGIVEKEAIRLGQPYITERWLGGTLTNFSTIRKSLKKLANINKIKKSITYKNLAKREKLMINRAEMKLERIMKGISGLNRIPAALFVVDIKNEAIAVKEARKLGIPVFAMVDTDSDPDVVNYPIPANDDSKSSIAAILKPICDSIEEGIQRRAERREEEKKQSSEESKGVKVGAKKSTSTANKGNESKPGKDKASDDAKK